MNSEMIIDINALNESSLSFRYNDPSKSLSFANEALEKSISINDEKWIAISKLNKLWCLFLRSELTEIIDELVGLTFYFSENKLENYHAETLLLTAQVQEGFGDYDSAGINAYKALELFQQTNIEWGKIQTLSLIGSIQTRIGEYSNAINTFKNCLELRLNDLPALASTHNQLARAYSLNNQTDLAEKHYLESIRIRKDLKLEAALSWSFLGVANVYEKKGDFLSANEYFEKALNCNNSEIDKRCRQQCILGKGRIKIAQNDLDAATDLLIIALALAEDIKANQLIFETYSALSEVEKMNDNFSKSLEYFQEYHRVKEQVFNSAQENKFHFIKRVHETEKAIREAEIFRIKNVELHHAYLLVEEKNKEITDSIHYASRIQNAFLPSEDLIKKLAVDSFVLFLPKDIVSGDFYFVADKGAEKIFVAADCTGHGVPGALLSVLGNSILNKAINEKNITKPSEILDFLNEEVLSFLQHDINDDIKDGMDISVCTYCAELNTLTFAGAYNSIYHISQNNLEEIKADKCAIGMKNPEKFHDNKINITKDSVIYMFSDGYPDQFGGDTEFGKKFKYSKLKELLLQIHKLPMEEQKEILYNTIRGWQGQLFQCDDILVMGLKF